MLIEDEPGCDSDLDRTDHRKIGFFLGKNDYDAAERHLRYWLSEAESSNDMRGKLTLLNEQIGLFRKTEKEAECLAAIGDALALADSMGMEKSVTYGITLINAATGFKAFGKAKEALPLYRKARAIYESLLDENDGRLGGLYNNMSLTLVDLKEFREAEELFHKAIKKVFSYDSIEFFTDLCYIKLVYLKFI